MNKLTDSNALTQIPVQTLSGIGERQAEKLQKLGIQSILDLLLHLPFRYEDRTHLTELHQLKPGMTVMVQGEVVSNAIIPGRRKMMFCQISDGRSVIGLRFFNFFHNQRKQLSQGQWVRCFGEARLGQRGYEIIHPEYRLIAPNESRFEEQTLTPIYPTTEGIGQASLRRWAESALKYLKQHPVPELLETSMREQFALADLTLKEAILLLHAPPKEADIMQLNEGQHPAQQRLIIEELLAHQLSLLRLKKHQKTFLAPAMSIDADYLEPLLKQLSFTPTAAQWRVYQEITTDIRLTEPMMRLVQGDVGSGKTLVALFAAMQVLSNGYQVALMAPTELLSEQHYEQFKIFFETLNINVIWLTSKIKGKQRAEVLTQIAETPQLMVIGTHALFQDQVIFKQLGLIIVDEQHRFGVHQRLSLKQKGIQDDVHPHQMIMTATPIPRTLAMSAYADLDTSVVDELPPGRTPVSTLAMSDDRREQIIQRLKHACEKEQRQVYWVCTLIEESEHLQCQAAENTFQHLQNELADLRIGLIHGRMKNQQKSETMQQFKSGQLDVLVATTVIEVGVDVPNASLMVIENAERLGLAQLHQLRGRVGRGAKASHCILLYHPPLSAQGEQRIATMRDSNDGFVIAEKDLELRGPGEVLGTKQTGVASFRIADLYRDRDYIPKVHQLAQTLINTGWQGAEPLIKRWVGERDQYAKV